MDLQPAIGPQKPNPLLQPEDRRTVTRVASEWLQEVGWESEDVLTDKLKLAESILEEVEALAADLPPVE